MPLDRYGVLKARPIACRQGRGRTPHLHIHAVDRGEDYRVSIDVRSRAGSSLLYLIDDRFEHPIVDRLRELPLGFRGIEPEPGGLALDYLRGELLDRRHMRRLPHDVPGPDQEFDELLRLWVGRALRDEDATLYAFGERFGPAHAPDPHFGFRPATGVYHLHMNQGSSVAEHAGRDGVWQDGGVILHFPAIVDGGQVRHDERWVAVFVAYASQRWDGEGC